MNTVQKNNLDAWYNYELSKTIQALETERNYLFTREDIHFLLQSMRYHGFKPVLSPEEIILRLFSSADLVEGNAAISSSEVRKVFGCPKTVQPLKGISKTAKSNDPKAKTNPSPPSSALTSGNPSSGEVVQWLALSEKETEEECHTTFQKATSFYEQAAMQANVKREMNKDLFTESIRFGMIGTRLGRQSGLESKEGNRKKEDIKKGNVRGDMLVIPYLTKASFSSPSKKALLASRRRREDLYGEGGEEDDRGRSGSLRGTLTRPSVAECRADRSLSPPSIKTIMLSLN